MPVGYPLTMDDNEQHHVLDHHLQVSSPTLRESTSQEHVIDIPDANAISDDRSDMHPVDPLQVSPQISESDCDLPITTSSSQQTSSSTPNEKPGFNDVSTTRILQVQSPPPPPLPLLESLGLEGCIGIMGGSFAILGIFGFLAFLWFGCKSL